MASKRLAGRPVTPSGLPVKPQAEPRTWTLLEEKGDKAFIGPPLIGGMSDEAAQEPVVAQSSFDAAVELLREWRTLGEPPQEAEWEDRMEAFLAAQDS